VNPLAIPRSVLSWAFPRGSHHRLLLAAIGRDADAGREAVRRWLNDHDIDDTSFRDQRLLLAVIGRFGNTLPTHPAFPRLLGLQKLLWSRSLLSMQEAKPTLQRIVDAGHPLLAIKGASRLATQEAARKLRVAWDIDVVVRGRDLPPVFDILIADQWKCSHGASHQYLKQNLHALRGLNLYKGNHGDIDLHSQPFHDGQGGPDEDRDLWDRSVPATLSGLSVQVPSTEDRLALALGHGGLDGHVHSDWLVDCAAIIQNEQIDWDLFTDIALARRLQVPANIMFRYFTEKLQLPIPQSVMQRFSAAPSTLLNWCIDLSHARPKDQYGPVGKAIRGLAKAYRRRSNFQYRTAATDQQLKTVRLKTQKTNPAHEFVKSFDLPHILTTQSAEAIEVDLIIDIAPFHGRRRIELEINSAEQHHCRIRYRRWCNQKGGVRLRACGQLPASAAQSSLTLASRPSRQLRPNAAVEERRRYDSVAFRLVSWQAKITSKRRAA